MHFVSLTKNFYWQNNIDFFVYKVLIVFPQLIVHFRSATRIITQFLFPLARRGKRRRWEGGLIGKWRSNFRGKFRVYRDSKCEFFFASFIWLSIYVRTERCCINCSFSLTILVYFVSLKVFLIVFFHWWLI